MERVEKLILDAYDVESLKELGDSLNMVIKVLAAPHSPGWVHVTAHNNDVFYAGYSDFSFKSIPLAIFTIDDDSKKADRIKEYQKSIKAIINRKKNQQNKLEGIKMKGIDKVKKFIEDRFKIDARLIEDSDIKWEEYKRFSVAGIVFNYEGTITDQSFIIHEYAHMSYAHMYELVTVILTYYSERESSIH